MGYQEYADEAKRCIVQLVACNRRCRRKRGYPLYILDIMEQCARDLITAIRAYRIDRQGRT